MFLEPSPCHRRSPHERYEDASRAGPESLARQHYSRPPAERHAGALHQRAVSDGVTSNPTIFDHAIKNSTAYDAAIQQKIKEGKRGEELFFELALEDLTRAADLFRPIWDPHGGSASTTPAHDR